MTRKNIIVIEDDEDILELILHNLIRDGFKAMGVATAEDAERKMATEQFDCIVLDLMLPGIDGLEFCRRVKTNPRAQNIPIIIVTAKGEEADIVTGLELGADDYVVKPFSPRVLVARIRSVLRRQSREEPGEEAVLNIKEMTIHPGRREVLIRGNPVVLSNLEFKVLHLLASRPGWVYTRYQIVENIRGDNYPVTDRSVDVLLVGLRRKLGDYGASIETVRGVGYRFGE